MKNLIATAAAVGLLTASPASAAGGTWDVYPTWDECVSAGELAIAENHTYTCSPAAAGGYELIWTRLQRTSKAPARGGKPAR